jgi:hypothetical protein
MPAHASLFVQDGMILVIERVSRGGLQAMKMPLYVTVLLLLGGSVAIEIPMSGQG